MHNILGLIGLKLGKAEQFLFGVFNFALAEMQQGHAFQQHGIVGVILDGLIQQLPAFGFAAFFHGHAEFAENGFYIFGVVGQNLGKSLVRAAHVAAQHQGCGFKGAGFHIFRVLAEQLVYLSLGIAHPSAGQINFGQAQHGFRIFGIIFQGAVKAADGGLGVIPGNMQPGLRQIAFHIFGIKFEQLIQFDFNLIPLAVFFQDIDLLNQTLFLVGGRKTSCQQTQAQGHNYKNTHVTSQSGAWTCLLQGSLKVSSVENKVSTPAIARRSRVLYPLLAGVRQVL